MPHPHFDRILVLAGIALCNDLATQLVIRAVAVAAKHSSGKLQMAIHAVRFFDAIRADALQLRPEAPRRAQHY